MRISVLNSTLAVCRLSSTNPIPVWATQGSFFSISKTDDELSIVCDQASVPDGVNAEREWIAFKVEGPLDFGLTGILASIANPLAQAKISIFAISTFETDYVLVKATTVEAASSALRSAGFSVI
jgi:hypothetical protein